MLSLFRDSPLAAVIGCVCFYPAIAFTFGVLFERYRRRYRLVRVDEVQEGREI